MKIEIRGNIEEYLKASFEHVIEAKENEMEWYNFFNSKYKTSFFLFSASCLLYAVLAFCTSKFFIPIAIIFFAAAAYQYVQYISERKIRNGYISRMKVHLENDNYLNSLDCIVECNEVFQKNDWFYHLDSKFITDKTTIGKLLCLLKYELEEIHILPNNLIYAVYVEEDGTIKDITIDHIRIIRNVNIKEPYFELKGDIAFYTNF